MRRSYFVSAVIFFFSVVLTHLSAQDNIDFMDPETVPMTIESFEGATTYDTTGASARSKSGDDIPESIEAEGSFSASAGGSDYSATATWSGYTNPCVIDYGATWSGTVTRYSGSIAATSSGNAGDGSVTAYPGPGRATSFTFQYCYTGSLCDNCYSEKSASATTAALKTPTSFAASDATSDQYVSLSWGKGTNVPSQYVSYYIYRNGSYVTTTTSTSYTATLTPGQNDTWEVATHADYAGSHTSSRVSNAGSTSAFRVPVISGISYETYIGYVGLSWSSNSDFATHFRIYRDGALIATVPRSQLSYQDYSIVNGKEYTYTVKAYNASYGMESPGANGQGKTFPMFPNASNGQYNNRVKVTWRNVSDFADEIKILRDTEEVGISSENATSFYDYDAIPGKLYQYSIIPISNGSELGAARDYGYIRPDGKIDGKVRTIRGAGVKTVKVDINPVSGDSSRSLQFTDVSHFSMKEVVKTIPENAFTVSFWLKSSDGTNSGTPFSYANATSDNAILIYNTNNLEVLVNGVSTGQTGISLTDGVWHHLTATWRNTDGLVRILVDGQPEYSGNIATGQTIANGGTLVLGQDQDRTGGNFQDIQAFIGNLDEIQVWNKVLEDSVIQNYMYKTLEGDEDGLLSYWPFDYPGRSPQNVTGDFARNGGNHMTVYGPRLSTDEPGIEQYTLTDPTGFYSLRNVFYSETSKFNLGVVKPRHGFDPTVQERTLELNSPTLSGVDFTDTTSYSVAGRVIFPGTSCGVPDVNIYLNNNFTAIKTDKQGNFLLSIEEPGTYSITPVLGDTSFPHQFSPSDVTLDIRDDVDGLVFHDTTTSHLAGRVGGGCDAVFGRGQIQITAAGNQTACIDTTFWTDVNGNYSIDLPSQPYLVELMDLNPPNPIITDAFGAIHTDLTFQDSTVNFIYRNPPQIRITGFPTACTEAPAMFRVPVMEQFTGYGLLIEVFEDYNGDTCLVDTGSVTIYDDIGGNAANPVTLPLDKGQAFYYTVVGDPNILDGGAHPFQKLFQVTADVDGKSANLEQWVLITGHKPREQTFVTKTPELPLLILRDPPGDQSYSFLEESSSLTRNFKMSHAVGGEGGLYWDVKIGAGIPIPFTGIVIGAYTKIEGEAVAGRDNNHGTTVTTTFTQTERFSTSDANNITGGKGDVIMGASFNMIYALTDVIGFDEETCTPFQDTTLAWGADGIATSYIYTEDHIENTLLPQLRLLQSLASPDSAILLGTFIEVWEQVLDRNHELKENAIMKKNISFSAGASRDYSETTTKDSTISFDFTTFIKAELKIGAGIGDGGKFASTEFGAVGRFRWSMSQAEDSTFTEGTTVGYHLGDDDNGDFFSVDVKEDPVYQTPVFELVAGTSSCPWEPGTQPRDGTSLAINKYEQNDIDPELPASFILNLGNLSQSGEAREYRLGIVQSSNFDGAIISVGGVVIEDFLNYTIPAGQQITATMAVHRGPVAYSYENLQLRLYSACDPSIADTVTFSVNYRSPCSTVELFRPVNNWLVNQSSNDSLLVIIRDYDTSNLNLETISLQYRRIGDTWKTAFVVLQDEIPNDYIYRFWNVSNLADGQYELRAVTKCGTDGVNYSSVSSGLIDRSSLMVFGQPQPSDRVLNIGEDISVRFTSELNCPALSAGRNAKLIDDLTGQSVPLDIACNGNTLILTPTVDLSAFERRSLTATVSAVEDVNGNTLQEPVSWTFTVNQNAVHWANADARISVYSGSDESFTATLINSGGTAKDFAITSLPGWLTSDAASGSLQAGGQRDLKFTINGQQNAGTYQDTVFVEVDGQGPDPLFIEALVLTAPPDWNVVASSYPYSMNIIAQISYGDSISSDEKDIVAAFSGNTIRGKATLQFVSEEAGYLAFLTVYGSQQVGEVITFRTWKASEGMESGFIEESVIFQNNGSEGSPQSPLTLFPYGRAQSIPLQRDWSWFSLNVEYDDMSINHVLQNIDAVEGDLVKGQTGMAMYLEGTGWVGDLNDLEKGKAYLISLSNEQSLRFAGNEIDLNTAPIGLQSGWNWIGYLPRKIRTVKNALSGYSPSNGDRIKGQSSFAVYNATEGSWQGSLTQLKPGEGYLLKASRNGILRYAQSSGSGSGLFSLPSGTYSAAPDDRDVIQASGYDVSPYGFESTMNIVGIVQIGGLVMADSNLMVLATSGDSLRGSGLLKYTPEVKKHMVFMTVYGNNTQNDSLLFTIINRADGSQSQVKDKVVFTQDAVLGTFSSPYPFVLVDEVPPLVSAAFHYSTEASLSQYLRLFISTNEPLLRNPVIQVTARNGGQTSLSTQVFNSEKHIYVLDYTVKDMGENTFFITATDYGENISQEVKELNVQRIRSGSTVAFSADPNMYINMEKDAAKGEGLLFCETLPSANTGQLPDHLQILSPVYELNASVPLSGHIELKYQLVNSSMDEESQRKIGLYRWNERERAWMYVSGQGAHNRVLAKTGEYGTYAVFYNDHMIPVPDQYALHQNYPNPFNPSTTFRFDVPNEGRVRMEIYNLLGQKIYTLLDQDMEAGFHKVTWNGTDAAGHRLASGIYIYRLHAGDYAKTRKMILLK